MSAEKWEQNQAEDKRRVAAEEDAVMAASGLTFTDERLTASTAAGSFVGTRAVADSCPGALRHRERRPCHGRRR
jgi:hypothetical protein